MLGRLLVLRLLLCCALLAGLGTAPALADPPRFGASKTPLGKVKFEGTEATVWIDPASPARETILVSVEFARPAGRPKIAADRLKLWVLRNNFLSGLPALVNEDSFEGETLPEIPGKDGVYVQAWFEYDDFELEHLAAVVVSLDGELTLFKLPPQRK